MEILQEHGFLEEVIEFCLYCLRCMGGVARQVQSFWEACNPKP